MKGFNPLGGFLYFRVQRGGSEGLWRTDGTTEGTERVVDVGFSSGAVEDTAVIGYEDLLLFAASDEERGRSYGERTELPRELGRSKTSDQVRRVQIFQDSKSSTERSTSRRTTGSMEKSCGLPMEVRKAQCWPPISGLGQWVRIRPA